MYTEAIEWGHVRTNPAKGVKLLKEAPARIRYLQTEEIKTLLDACNDHIRPIVFTALNTGMRKAEILNLKWANVDLKNMKIIVNNAKNNKTRVIPINNSLYHELSGLRRSSNGSYVFADKNGRPYGEIKRSFASSLKRAEIKDFRFHDLRHTFGSYMVMQGVDIRTVQQLMGHKDIKMTMRYSHLSPEYVKEAIGRLDTAWTLYGHQSKLQEKEIFVTN